MPVRRAADPTSVQHIWDAVRCASSQRQMADLPRIIRYLQRVNNCTQAQAQLYIKQILEDGLIVAVQKVSSKSTNVGEHVESYRIPLQEIITPDDGKDWYCIECHLAGNVISCRSCFRVFHEECGSNAKQKSMQKGMNLCSESKVTNNMYKPSTSNSDYMNLFALKDCRVVLNNTINFKSSCTNDKRKNNSSEITNEVTSSKLDYSHSNFNDNCNTGMNYDESLCSVCNLCNNDIDFISDKEELNHLLFFVLERIKSWIPENITMTMSQGCRQEWHNEAELRWRAKQLIYEYIDMPIMDVKIRSQEYSRLCDFQADVLTVQHNVAIFHGTDSQEYGATELMLRDCLHDITELKNCVDCYRHSNEKINNRWFCFPCRIPHKLVWAKQKGYPYWPAKVIKENENIVDVRFFGGKYERSVLPKNYIKPITAPFKTLQIKKTSAFNKAYEELLFHQKLLENPEELEHILKQITNRKRNYANDISSKKAQKEVESTISNVYEFQDCSSNKETVFLQKENDDAMKISPIQSCKRKSLESDVNLPKAFKKVDRRPHISSHYSNIIHISDAEDSENDFFSKDSEGYAYIKEFHGNNELVSSSTEFVQTIEDSLRENSDNSMQQLEQPYNDAVEKMRRKLEQCKNKKQLIKMAMDCMQSEVDKITNDHNEHLKKIIDAHNLQISETKKKQWCYNCEQDAIYHCCWNTAYCSQTCQQQHWQAEHKKVCRRKR